MANRPPIVLKPLQIDTARDEFQEIQMWGFADSFVIRLLIGDLPQRMLFGNCRLWIYRDANESLVGFGSLDFGDELAALTGGLAHAYIPLLAVKPDKEGLGYGSWILQHLVGEAYLLKLGMPHLSDVLLLDVYAESDRAIRLYERNGFQKVVESLADPDEGGRLYHVMAKRISR